MQHGHQQDGTRDQLCCSFLILKQIKTIFGLLKVAFSQKMLENFYVSNMNIPIHYPEQKI